MTEKEANEDSEEPDYLGLTVKQGTQSPRSLSKPLYVVMILVRLEYSRYQSTTSKRVHGSWAVAPWVTDDQSKPDCRYVLGCSTIPLVYWAWSLRPGIPGHYLNAPLHRQSFRA